MKTMLNKGLSGGHAPNQASLLAAVLLLAGAAQALQAAQHPIEELIARQGIWHPGRYPE